MWNGFTGIGVEDDVYCLVFVAGRRSWRTGRVQQPAQRPATGGLRVVARGDQPIPSPGLDVNHWCMARTNIDIDDVACDTVMRRYHLASKRDAVNFALRTVASEALDLDQARGLRGSGWEGDLDALRASRAG